MDSIDHELGHLDGRQTDENGNRIHKEAYIILRNEARSYQTNGIEPPLQESEKPYGARQWNVSAETVAAYAAAGEEIPEPIEEIDEWI
jgi:hypothetical protein